VRGLLPTGGDVDITFEPMVASLAVGLPGRASERNVRAIFSRVWGELVACRRPGGAVSILGCLVDWWHGINGNGRIAGSLAGVVSRSSYGSEQLSGGGGLRI